MVVEPGLSSHPFQYLLDDLEDMGAPLQHAIALLYAELEICPWETVILATRSTSGL